MTAPFPFASDPEADRTAQAAVEALADSIAKTVRLSRAFASSNRPVDLAGLDSGVGLLCAKALDLPPDRGRQLRPRLVALRQELEELGRTLREGAPP